MKYSKDEIQEKLKGSLEMRDVRNQTTAVGIILCIALPAALGINVGVQGGISWAALGVMEGIVILSCLVFWLCRRHSILRCPEGYTFHRVTLDQPRSGDLRGRMYFAVELEMPDGSRKKVNTRDIFSTHNLVGPRLEDYVNKEVTVAYNAQTCTVVFIG